MDGSSNTGISSAWRLRSGQVGKGHLKFSFYKWFHCIIYRMELGDWAGFSVFHRLASSLVSGNLVSILICWRRFGNIQHWRLLKVMAKVQKAFSIFALAHFQKFLSISLSWSIGRWLFTEPEILLLINLLMNRISLHLPPSFVFFRFLRAAFNWFLLKLQYLAFHLFVNCVLLTFLHSFDNIRR